MALLATFAGLRWGELVALRPASIDLEQCEIRITETIAELDRGDLLPETPKSRAGRRSVNFPAELVDELSWHLEQRLTELRESIAAGEPPVMTGPGDGMPAVPRRRAPLV